MLDERFALLAVVESTFRVSDGTTGFGGSVVGAVVLVVLFGELLHRPKMLMAATQAKKTASQLP